MSLAADPLAWIFLFAAAGLAGAVYSGSFQWLSNEATERVAGVMRWAPTGALGLVGVVFGGGLKRRMSRWKGGAGDADALMKILEAESNSFLELVRVHIDDGPRKQIPRLAQSHEVGLIQRTVWSLSERAVDQGRLLPSERDELLSALMEIQPGRDERSVFFNRIAALELTVKLVDIDELARCLSEAEWRSAGDRRTSKVGKGSSERRTGPDRRVRSAWRPQESPPLELAG